MEEDDDGRCKVCIPKHQRPGAFAGSLFATYYLYTINDVEYVTTQPFFGTCCTAVSNGLNLFLCACSCIRALNVGS